METKQPYIIVRATDGDKQTARTLAEDYGTDVSGLIRALLQFAERERPTLVKTVVLKGKAPALDRMMA